MNTLPEINQLIGLAKTIRESHEEAIRLVKLSEQKCTEAVEQARLCGLALIEAKKIIDHGNWLEWINEHCSGLSRWTAGRYMRLANGAHVHHLDGVQSLRQAYIAAGIIREPTKPLLTINQKPKEIPCTEPQSPATSQGQTSSNDSPTINGDSVAAPSVSSAVVPCDKMEPAQPQITSGGRTEDYVAPQEQTGGFSQSSETEIPEEFKPFEFDPFERIRRFVAEVMIEIHRLGPGAKGGVIIELGPILQWESDFQGQSVTK